MANKTVVLDGELSLDIVNDGELDLNTEIDGDVELNIVNDGDPNINANIDGTAVLEMAYDGEYGLFYAIHDDDPYTGDYEATPMTAEQTFYTQDKYMTGNFRVLEIPYHEVSNLSGGYTATIGE